jgi:acetate kinase
MKILVVNCGSSSIKYQLFEMPQRAVLGKGLVERIGETGSALSHTSQGHTERRPTEVATHEQGLELVLRALTEGPGKLLGRIDEIEAVGHRVVHGADEFTGSMLITEQVLATIERVAHLAPLHNPPNLAGIRAAQRALPCAAQVACFDTAFHTTLPPVAYTYALPYTLCEQYRIRRYGFHGTSHRYLSGRAAQWLGVAPESVNLITCHLGNGCSMAAVQRGRSIDTTMGLTPLEGLVMGTRTGDLDPAILFYLGDNGYDIATLNRICNTKSGLIGISGSSNDLRTLGEKAAAGDARARLAIDVFCYHVKKYIGAYCAVLGTVDAVVWTGGIGEHGWRIRAQCCDGLPQLGIALDPQRNAAVVGCEGEIQAADSRVKLLVIPTDEEGVIAADTYELVKLPT